MKEKESDALELVPKGIDAWQVKVASDTTLGIDQV
jgi:hypothetical protein